MNFIVMKFEQAKRALTMWGVASPTAHEYTNILSYNDFDSISEYAIGAMQYACGSDLIKGRTESTLNPNDNATRAEIAAVLHRFIENNK